MLTNMLKEFRDFAVKGNVVDLAVGVIIGAAFGNIVSSLVGDIFMPVIGAVTGGLDFSNYYVPLSSAVTAENLADAKKQGAVLAYGAFITIAINLIVAAILFMLVRGINHLRRQQAESAAKAPPPAPTATEALLTEIRDLLKAEAGSAGVGTHRIGD
jgi:large conductance mechanosensitive channel